jgi:threonine/homoserine/homoserine lactone efflux protein
MAFSDYISLIILGVGSSFLGALPLGTLNLSILKLALSNRHEQALAFAWGAALVELLQVTLILVLMNFLLPLAYLKTFLAAVSIPILLILGIKSLYNTPTTEGGVAVKNAAFRQGALLSFANVMVYPFWLLWGNIFVENGWLNTDFWSLLIFSLGVGVGTLGAFLVFVYLGKLLWRQLAFLQFWINRLIALAFFGFAAGQIGVVLRILIPNFHAY